MSQSRAKRRPRISLASRAGDRRSPFGWAVSVSLHVLVLAATLFTWQHTLDIVQETPPVVPVDLVTLGQKTNVAPAQKQQPKIEPPKTTAAVEPDQLTQPAMPDIAEPAPQQAPSEPKIEPKPAPPVPMPRQPAPPKKTSQDRFAALLNKLTAPEKTEANAKTATRTIKGIGAQTAMVADLQDLLRSQMAQCWSPPAAAPNPAQLVVTLRVFLNPDGSVAQPPQLSADSKAAAASDPYVRAAADAATRAIYVCQPYKLPVDRYAQWRDIEMVFDPRVMAGLKE